LGLKPSLTILLEAEVDCVITLAETVNAEIGPGLKDLLLEIVPSLLLGCLAELHGGERGRASVAEDI